MFSALSVGSETGLFFAKNFSDLSGPVTFLVRLGSIKFAIMPKWEIPFSMRPMAQQPTFLWVRAGYFRLL